jgi:predicted MPP superfamily phosphohydrolase
LPFGGVVFDNIADKRFVSGLVAVGGQAVYTSNGIGVVEIPLRVNCPPEVTVLTLRAMSAT